MDNINIVELIEKNPISKLNTTHNNKLLKKIKQNFNQDEQKLFITSFYCYLNYDKTKDFIIDLDDIWKWLGFQSKFNAKRLLERFFIVDKNYKNLLRSLEKQDCNTHGGHNKEIFMLNIQTFKKFCLKAGTNKANEIHDYFIKLEEVIQETLVEQTQEFANEIKNLNTKMIQDKAVDRHNLLYTKFANAGSLIYLIKVKSNEDNTWIIKIGESRIGIANRVSEHKIKYDECVIMDCFTVQRSKDFEAYLHSHPEIKSQIVNDLKGHEKERELFRIGKDLTYKKLINIINNNIQNYNNNPNISIELEKIKAENENLKLINNMKSSDNLFIKELIELNKKLFDKIDNLEKSNKEILEKINSIQVKNITTTNFGEVNKTVGQRLQKINPETLTLIKTYDYMAEALKENPKLKRSSINKAICENIIYHGFRWLSIDRELDPTKIHKIEPTKEIKTKIQNLGYIAKLNKEKTEILNVYIDRKTACKFNDYKSISALDNHVKNKTETNGNYYILYDDCDKELKNNFVKKYGKEPLLYKNGIGQYDLKNNLLQEFCSKQQCCQSVGIGDKSLSKALENKIYYNDYFYKYLDDKIKCL